MTTVPSQMEVAGAIEGDLTDDLYGDISVASEIHTNLGQAAGLVYGGMHQTIVENKFLSEFVRRHQLAGGYLEQVMRTFAPRTYRLHGSDLVLDHVGAGRLASDKPWIVLLGPSGSGLRTAAVALLREAFGTGRRFEEVLIDEESERMFAGVDLPAERGVCYLLRLPDQPQRISPDLGRHLQVHAAHLAQLNAHLVVATTAEAWRVGGGGDNAMVVEVTPPDPAGVVLRECAAAGVDATSIVAHPKIGELVADASTPDAVRLARILIAARRNQPTADVDSVVREVYGAYGDWDEELAAWFGDERRGLRERLFLVAAAMLEGEPAAAVLSTVNSLGRCLGDLTAARPDGLAEPGLRALVGAIDADVVAGLLRFRRANYASAVLTFVEGDRSAHFQRKLWEWAVDLPLDRSVSRPAPLAEKIVTKLLATVLRTRNTLPLVQLNRWTGRPQFRPLVVQALTAAAVSDEVGVEVRALLYRWSRSRVGDQSLCAIAEVCSGELADLYPRVSLTRLGHLAARESADVRAVVVDAIARLWDRKRLRELVLERLADWVTGDQAARAETAWRALASVSTADAHPFVLCEGTPALRSAFVLAAARLFDQPDPGPTRTMLAASVFEAALEGEVNRDILGVFLRDVVRHGDGGTRRLVRISRLIFEWQPVAQDASAPQRRVLRDHLIENLHHADPLVVRG